MTAKQSCHEQPMVKDVMMPWFSGHILIPSDQTIREFLSREGISSAFIYKIIDKVENGEYFLTSEPHRDGNRLSLDATVGEIAKKDATQERPVLSIYEWEVPKRACNRCGQCCMIGGSTTTYKTPVSPKKWPGKGKQRCKNLHFDDVKGIYECMMPDKRATTCEEFICSYMKGGTPNYFSVKPDITSECCQEKIYAWCTQLATRVEWFIAYARKHSLKQEDKVLAAELREHLVESKELYPASTHRGIDPAWADHLISVLDEITTKRKH